MLPAVIQTQNVATIQKKIIQEDTVVINLFYSF